MGMMGKIVLDQNCKSIFQKNKKCIINTDLDGLISGMLLQQFLNWEVVGYSCCCGRPNDELWMKDLKSDIESCIFVDLPVYVRSISAIDQHFVAFDESTISDYKSHKNKVNPNIIRNRVFNNSKNQCEYTKKYPFGTAHFVLAVLENMGYISEEYAINFSKSLDKFDVADLILRADRVIGNTAQYTPNCFDWAKWIIDVGGKNTSILFNSVLNDLTSRKIKEPFVEEKLKSLGCDGLDGDCSNLFRSKDFLSLRNYFNFLSESIELKPITLFDVVPLNNLSGRRWNVYYGKCDFVKNEAMKDDVFSFAFVNMKVLSMTYKKGR